jgi:hypothetical protein
MTLMLELPPELETELAAEAAVLRLPLAEYALRLLAVGRISGLKPQTGAELITYWQKSELVGTRSDIGDAPTHARELREKAQNRKPE